MRKHTAGKVSFLRLEKACKDNEVIYSAINTYDGKLTCKNVADSFECYEYVDIRTLTDEMCSVIYGAAAYKIQSFVIK